jgi:hypothetical protein
VRADGERRVLFEGQDVPLSEVVEALRARGDFHQSRAVDYHGRQAPQWVAEAPVVLHRPARPQRKGQKRANVPGSPLRLRRVVSELRLDGQAQERWLLLTNVPAAVTAERVALWYFWRWLVEILHLHLHTGRDVVADQLQPAPLLPREPPWVICVRMR